MEDLSRERTRRSDNSDTDDDYVKINSDGQVVWDKNYTTNNPGKLHLWRRYLRFSNNPFIELVAEVIEIS